MKGRTFGESVRARALALITSGAMSYREVARTLGTSERWVSKLALSAGLTKQPHARAHHRVPERLRARALGLLARGHSVPAVADRLGVSVSTISAIKRAAGLTKATPGQSAALELARTARRECSRRAPEAA